jgi:hypothetical protein
MIDKYRMSYETLGYFKHAGIPTPELVALQEYVNNQWRRRLVEVYPDLAAKTSEMSIADYHFLRSDVNHSALWPKRCRLFDQRMVDRVRNFEFIAELRELFGDFQFTEQSYDGLSVEGTEEIYWRLVCPNEETDIGGIHADCWFHRLHELSSASFSGRETIKVWIPLVVESGLNGLLVVPRSHRQKWDYGYKLIESVKYPILIESVDDDSIILEPTEPGQYICFGENFLHGGALNRGRKTRVSIEITLSRSPT